MSSRKGAAGFHGIFLSLESLQKVNFWFMVEPVYHYCGDENLLSVVS